MRVKGQRLSTPTTPKKPPKPKESSSPSSYGVKFPRTPLDEMTGEQQAECWFHFPSFCYHYLKIWTKPDANADRHLIPFKWNRAQRERWRKRSLRDYWLKNRQVGATTWEDASDFHIAVTKPAANVTLLTHSKELCENNRDIVHTFLENMPKGFEVDVAGDNRDGFKFRGVPAFGLILNSSYRMMTVSGKQKGIGKTLDKLHMTEVSRWEDVTGGVGNYISVAVQALAKSVPVVLETTPNGLGHPSFGLWKKASAGEWGFNPLFIPWWFDETAVRSVPENFQSVDAKEQKLLRLGVSPENIMFRREKILEMHTEDFDGEVMFNQEYPSDPRTCFISGGKNAFSVERLLEQERNVDIELDIWRESGVPFPKTGSMLLGKTAEHAVFSEQSNGPYTIWERPKPGRQYVIGADVGKGKETGDYSAAVVLRADTVEQVAQFHDKPYPQEFAHILSLLGYHYNQALIIPEKNTDGNTVIMGLYDLYPNVYQAQKIGKGFVEETFNLGWHNNQSSRALAINLARNLVWERNVRIRSKVLIEELQAFVKDKSGKYQGPRSGHDDLAWAFMIALWGLKHGTFASEAPWAPGDTKAEIEEIRRFTKRQAQGDDVWGEQYEDDVRMLFL